jgi:hypothetical protein
LLDHSLNVGQFHRPSILTPERPDSV